MNGFFLCKFAAGYDGQPPSAVAKVNDCILVIRLSYNSLVAI